MDLNAVEPKALFIDKRYIKNPRVIVVSPAAYMLHNGVRETEHMINSMAKLVIDIGEQFQRLPRAPIVEAVIDIRAREGTKLEEETVKEQLGSKVRGYQFLDSRRKIQVRQDMNLGAVEPTNSIIRDLGWKGLRFQSTDEKHIVQFNRDGFVFSRLEPYQNWEQLNEESMRLWELYAEMAKPVEIHRIGLRYINRIQLPLGDVRFEDYFDPAPVPPKDLDLPFQNFMQHDTLATPDHPYAINVIRTMQPHGTGGNSGLGLILDIDAFTTQGFELEDAELKKRLLEMRWLKNKVFFGSITLKALKLFE